MRLTERIKHFVHGNILSIDERIVKSTTSIPDPYVRDAFGQIVGGGILDGGENILDSKLLDNQTEIMSLLMKASGQSQHVVPSFYQGGDDVYIANKEREDVTVTDGDRRAIHTISNYYNTLGIYRDDFNKTDNDKLARNAYYAICEKAMMDYMRSVQFSIKDRITGERIEPAMDFFETPNPQDDFGSILASLIRDVTRYDAGVIVKTFNKAGYVVEIKPYLATEFWREQDRVPFIINVPIMNTVDLTGGAYASHQQPTYQGWWSHGYTERFWQRSRTGVYIPFQPEEIAYFMMYPRTDGIYGTDFIKFLKYQIQYLIDSTKAAGKTFENGVVPSVVWEHPEIHTVQQLKQRIAELKYNNQGWQRFGSVIHTVNGEKVTSVAQSLHDMQWLEGQKFVAQLVWATWGFSPEEFMGGGENRATAYVKRNITKSRLLYPLMTFIEGRINREILPYLEGYRATWKFQFVRDIELDDEQKVATTNSIKASTFLQYYSTGFPIKESMELSGLDPDSYKFDIDQLEAQIMQNQMAMLGQQPGEQQMEPGDTEEGRYNGDGSYVDANLSDYGQGAAGSDRDPRDPSIDEEQYKKAREPQELPRAEKTKKKWSGKPGDPVPMPQSEHDELGKGVPGVGEPGYTTRHVGESSGHEHAGAWARARERSTSGKTKSKWYNRENIESKEHEKKPSDKKGFQFKKPYVPMKQEHEKDTGRAETDTGGGKTTGHQTHWEGGVAKALKKQGKRPDEDYDQRQLKMGIKIEMEHTDDLETAKHITKDHLDESPIYYSKLKKMEADLTKADMETPGTFISYMDNSGIMKAKVYIAHPSEAPKGRTVRRGAKGGYYYITNERQRGGAQSVGTPRRPAGGGKGKHKGWQTGSEKEESTGGSYEGGAPPDIAGAEMVVKVSGKGVGLSAGIVNGKLIAKKLPNKETDQFIEDVQKISGEQPLPEKIIASIVKVADDQGLDVEES